MSPEMLQALHQIEREIDGERVERPELPGIVGELSEPNAFAIEARFRQAEKWGRREGLRDALRILRSWGPNPPPGVPRRGSSCPGCDTPIRNGVCERDGCTGKPR